jgi:tetratricopeptide (TPR) repeat protein
MITREDIDLYGFSLIGTYDSNRIENEAYPVSRLMKEDENWNNPESVKLMMEYFKIDDPYSNHIQPIHQNFTYLTLRNEQRKLFCAQFLSESKRCLREGKYSDALQAISESIRYDSSTIEALLTRVDIYVKLGMTLEAIADCKKVISIDSNNQTAHALLSRHGVDVFSPKEPQPNVGLSSTITRLRQSIEQSTSAVSAGKEQPSMPPWRRTKEITLADWDALSTSDSSSFSHESIPSHKGNKSEKSKKAKKSKKRRRRESAKHRDEDGGGGDSSSKKDTKKEKKKRKKNKKKNRRNKEEVSVSKGSSSPSLDRPLSSGNESS